jgi:predicted amidohydrolase YtcJ
MKLRCCIALFTSLVSSACLAQATQGEIDTADMVLGNGAIYTVSAARSWASAVAIKDGEIVYVGTDVGAQGLIGSTTEVIDLQGKMLLPGFQDAHTHLVYGTEYLACSVYDLPNKEAVLAEIKSCVDENPDAPIIRGTGWTIDQFEGGMPPRKELLDAIDSTRPLVFGDADGHAFWANSKTFELYGISRDMADPEGGKIQRDPVSGEIWGTLHEESAMNLIKDRWPAYTNEEIMAGLKYALDMNVSLGITAAQEAIVKLDSRDNYRSLPAFKALNDRGELKNRISLSLYWDASKGMGQIATFKKVREENSGGRLRVNTVKFWADGVVETHTAWMLEPYTNKPDSRGILMVPEEQIMEGVPLVDKEGFQLHYHAIGDGAVRIGLNAVEAARQANGERDSRPHMVHAQFVHPDDIARFGGLNMTANFQPLWAYEDDYISVFTRPVVGPERIKWTYPIRAIKDAGGRIAFGSDWAVSSANPLEGIEVAVTRVDPFLHKGDAFLPEQAISLEDAIEAYTLNSAYVNFLDDKTGSIEVGKYADLIVLDKNLFDIPVTEISEVKVLLTLLEGNPVYGTLEDLKR